MKTVKISEASGMVLNWLVCKAGGGKMPTDYKGICVWIDGYSLRDMFHYSTNWSQGGPIIEREKINLSAYQLPEEGWQAFPNYGMSDWYTAGPTPLISAMRCYVTSLLGDTAEVPEELLR